MPEQQVLRMARPAAYWARRAAFHHQRGNRHQAEALYQHAVTLTPDNVSLKLAYARVLQEMHHYEASNRQAFAALAQDPDCGACVGLIGQNLMALGYLEEAADAFTHAMYADPTGMTDAYADSLDRLDLLLYPAEEPSVRYRLLVQRAAEALASGAWTEAQQTLASACAMPRRDERCHTLMALYCRATGDLPQAIRQAAAACAIAPQSLRAYCTLAELYNNAGRRGKALETLLRGASRVLTAEDERLLCHAAISLKFPTAPLSALSRLGGCVHTLFNQAVLLLKAGQPQRAVPLLDRCRALDPDDVPTRYLRRTAQALSQLAPAQAARQAEALRLYPALSDEDSEARFRTFLQASTDGAEPFAKRLQTDSALYRLTLYQVENPHADISGLLEQVIPHLNENFTEKLFREILTLPMGGVAEKQLAIQALAETNARPFVLWHDGRLSFVSPRIDGETNETHRLREQLLRLGGAGDPALTAYALRLIHRLPLRVRRKLAAAQPSDLRAAVQMHYETTRPAARPQDTPHTHRVERIYRMLLRAAPAPNPVIMPPRLWISNGREETPHGTD